MCWAVRAEGGCDRTVVWRGNPCFECPPAGNLNEFKLHLSVSCACTHAHRNVSFVLAISTFLCHRYVLFCLSPRCRLKSKQQSVCKDITNFTVWHHPRTEFRKLFSCQLYDVSLFDFLVKCSDVFEKRKISCLCTGFEPRTIHPVT